MWIQNILLNYGLGLATIYVCVTMGFVITIIITACILCHQTGETDLSSKKYYWYVCIQFSGTESPSLFWLPIKNVLKFVSAEPKLSMVIYRTPVILQQKYDPNHDSTSIIRNYPPPPPYEMATKMPKVEVTWKFCKFITALVTIFDHSSVLKFLNLVKKNKQIQFSQLFYFLMHFSFLPWWCTLKMEELVRFCKKMLAGFPTWEIQLLLRIKTKLNLKKYLFIFYFHNKPNTSYEY